jgi:hypothetical protein
MVCSGTALPLRILKALTCYVSDFQCHTNILTFLAWLFLLLLSSTVLFLMAHVLTGGTLGQNLSRIPLVRTLEIQKNSVVILDWEALV